MVESSDKLDISVARGAELVAALTNCELSLLNAFKKENKQKKSTIIFNFLIDV